MLNWFKKRRSEQPVNPIRDTLFGDMPLEEWARAKTGVSPWSEFAEVVTRLQARDISGATALLQHVIQTPGLESRHYLQAWHQLRKLGNPPEAGAKQLFGVVVEVALDEGLDILAAYADYSARYFNYSGAAVVWEHPDSSLDPRIERLLQTAGVILDQIGPWESARPPVPPRGQARISMLASSGLHFGQAPLETLAGDRLAGATLTAATELMQALIAKAEAARTRA